MIKNICGSEIIESKQVRNGKIRHQLYNLNVDYIKEHLKLNQYINPSASDFHNEHIERFNIKENEELLKQNKKTFKLLVFFEE